MGQIVRYVGKYGKEKYMIKVEVKNGAVNLTAKGNPVILSADVCLVVESIYKSLEPTQKAMFKNFVQQIIADSTTIWSNDN